MHFVTNYLLLFHNHIKLNVNGTGRNYGIDILRSAMEDCL